MNTSQLKAMATHAAKKDTRTYLNGVRIHRQHIVATDGHRMACYPHNFTLPALTEDSQAYFIPHSVINALDKKQAEFSITEEGVLTCGHLTVPLELVQKLDYLMLFADHTLPDYDCEGELMPLNARYLADAGKLAALFTTSKRRAELLKEGIVEARTAAAGADMSIVLTHSELFICIMPFRASKKSN